MTSKSYIYTLEVNGETYVYMDKAEAKTNYEYEKMMGNNPKLFRTMTLVETCEWKDAGIWI